jgi:hypothetical protein
VNGTSRWKAGLSLSEELIDGSGLGGQKVVRAGLAGVEQVVLEQAGKARLRATSGASAVDMESHIAAAYATAAGLPFAALRVISDPATRALPAIARNAVKPNGSIDLKKVLRGLVRNPLTLRALVSTGVDFNRALRSLRGCRGFLLGGESLVPAEYVTTPLVARPRVSGSRKSRAGEAVPARRFSGLRGSVPQPARL